MNIIYNEVMLVIGKKTKFMSVEGHALPTFNIKSAIFFGKNGDGKTTLFKKMNKKIHYEYDSIDRNVTWFTSTPPMFLNQNMKVSRIKREVTDSNFIIENLVIYKKLSPKIYASLYKGKTNINQKNTWTDSYTQKQCDVNDNFIQEHIKNFSVTVHDLKKVEFFIAKVFQKFDEDDKKSIIDCFLFSSKLFINLENRLSKRELKAFYLSLKFFGSFDEGIRRQVHSTKKKHSFEDTMRGFIAKYEDLIFYAGYKINNEIASAALRAPKMTAKIKKTVIKLLNNNIIFGKSYGIKRYNKILEVVSDNIANTQSFVFDDPFDGMDNNTISKLSNVISQLQNLGVNFLIFTNNIEAYRTIKLSNGNFSGFIIEKYFNKFIFENITDVDNIIFKYNDYKYYEQLDQLLMRWDIHISIRELILACHRQYLYESKELLNLTVASKSIIKSVESIYNFSTDALKIRITAPKLINKKYRSKEISLLPQIAGNYIEHIILLLRTNTMSDAFYWQSNNFYFLNKILLKTFITSLYDSALKRIESLIDDTKLIQKNSANFCSVIRKKIRTFESTRDKIAHPREHMFISNHLAINSEELEIWLDIFVYCIDLNRIKLISNTSQEIRKFKELESRSKK